MTGWEPLLDDLAARRDAARAMGGPERLEAHRRGGRLDAGRASTRSSTPARSWSSAPSSGRCTVASPRRCPPTGSFAGHGLVDGRPVLAGAEDFTGHGRLDRARHWREAPPPGRPGAPGARAARAVPRGCGRAGAEGVQAARAQPERPAGARPRLSGLVPTVAVVLGTSAGHGALAAPLMDLVVMVEGAALFAAGPPLVQAAMGETVTKEELGGTAIHTTVSGVAHNTAPDDRAALDFARRYLPVLPVERVADPASARRRRHGIPPSRRARRAAARRPARLRRAPRRRADLRPRLGPGGRARARPHRRHRARRPRRCGGGGRRQPAGREGRPRSTPRAPTRRRTSSASPVPSISPSCSSRTTRACSRSAAERSGSCATRRGCSPPRPGSPRRSCTSRCARRTASAARSWP